MDFSVSNGKIELDFQPGKKAQLRNFIHFYMKKDQVERQYFLKHDITPLQIKLVTEIILNFLNGRITPNFRSLQYLKRCKKFMQRIISKTISKKLKKTLISSLQSLHVLNILLPLVYSTIK